jgi:hypothetical protein
MIGYLITAVTLLLIITAKKKSNKMDEYIKKYQPEKLASWNVPYTGNVVNDFNALTIAQGGGKSDRQDDYASKWPPPVSDNDGKYYHTVHDITYLYWKTSAYAAGITNNSPEAFYKMSFADHKKMVAYHFKLHSPTTSKKVNAFISYTYWAGNSTKMRKAFYKKTGYYFQGYIDKFGSAKTFDIAVIVYVTTYEKDMTAYSATFKKGWIRGILAVWHLFKNYN